MLGRKAPTLHAGGASLWLKGPERAKCWGRPGDRMGGRQPKGEGKLCVCGSLALSRLQGQIHYT